MKLYLRFFYPALCVITVSMTLLGGILLASSFHIQLEQEKRALVRRTDLCAYGIESACANYALQNIELSEELLEEIAAQQDAQIVLRRAERLPKRTVRLDGQSLYAQRPLDLPTGQYLLVVASDISNLFEHQSVLLQYYRAAYSVAILLAVGASYGISRSLTRPLSELTEVSRALSAGQLDRRAIVQTKDEIGELARDFNQMANALSEQLERQEHFIESFTHEIKTPLTAMIGQADIIRSGRLEGEEMQIAAHAIVGEGKRLNTLAETMTEWILLKREDLPLADLPVHQIFADALASFPDEARAGRLVLAADAGCALIQGNRALLSALLANLIRNALNANAKNVRLGCKIIDGERVRISVADDGIGIDAQSLPHITEPFYRVDKARSRSNGGAGFGLALCAEIATAHGGELSFRSQPGKGTEAILVLRGGEAECSEELDQP